MISRSVSSSRSDVGSSGQQDIRIIDESTRDHGAALLASRDFRRKGVRISADAKLVEQLNGGLIGVSRHAGVPQQRRQGDVVDNPQRRQQARELEHEAHVAVAKLSELVVR